MYAGGTPALVMTGLAIKTVIQDRASRLALLCKAFYAGSVQKKVRAMLPMIANITLLVPDYDAGLAFYRDVLGFDLLEDTDMGEGKRWVRVAPKGGGAALLLAKAKGGQQVTAIGNQAGGRVAFFLHTDDFDREYKAVKAAGCEFTGPVREETYGRVVVFIDPFGNLWDLIQPE